jgi:hypothetical protein
MLMMHPSLETCAATVLTLSVGITVSIKKELQQGKATNYGGTNQNCLL